MSTLIKERCHRGAFEISLLRRGLGFYLLLYYLPFALSLKELFFNHEMIDRFLIQPPMASLLFLFPSWSALLFFYCLLILFSFLLMRDRLPLLGVFFLYVLNLSFHQANPLLIHEPQQIANFLLILLLFFPIQKNKDIDFFLLQLLVSFFAFYYFVAGFKKLLDPLWLNGSALAQLWHWEGLGRWPLTNFDQMSLLSAFFFRFLNYTVLLLELSVPLWIFTRQRYAGLLFLVAMHIGIKVFMDVGSFSEIMIVWQLCAWDEQSRSQLRKLYQCSKNFFKMYLVR